MSSLTYNPVPFDHTYILYDPSDPISILASFFSLLPIGILIFYFSWLLLTREIEPVIIAGGQVVNDIVNSILKGIIKQERPRPDMMTVTSMLAESSFSTTLGRGLEYGMPSAHAQFMGFFLAYFSLKIAYQSNRWCLRDKVIGIISCFLAAFGVTFSRVYLMYHTREQVFFGILIGFFLGSTYFAIISVARDIGFISWIINWPICKKFWLKDTYFECPLSFEDEYNLWLKRKQDRYTETKSDQKIKDE